MLIPVADLTITLEQAGVLVGSAIAVEGFSRVVK